MKNIPPFVDIFRIFDGAGGAVGRRVVAFLLLFVRQIRLGKNWKNGSVGLGTVRNNIVVHKRAFCRLEVAAGAVSGRSVRFELDSSRFVEKGVGQARVGTARDVDRRVI